jgi:tetratricopeptide (TPR) repeat protein
MNKTIKILSYIFPAVIVVIPASATSAQTPSDETQNRISRMAETSRDARWKLRYTGISSIQNNEMSRKELLQQSIDRVKALELPKPKQIVSEIKPAQETMLRAVSPQPAPAISAKQQEPKEPEIYKKELLLKLLVDNPDNIVDPLDVAESLFSTGNLKDAAKFYRLALQRSSTDKQDPDRPWILLQLANCFRHENPDRAYNIYQELISEYSGSYLVPTAKAQQSIISWFKEKKPITVLEKYGSDPNSL